MANKIREFLKSLFKESVSVNYVENFDSLMDELNCQRLAILQAVSIVAAAISKCEFKVYQNGEISKGKEYYSWNVKANNNQSAAEFKHELVTNLLLHTEALIFENRKGRFVAENCFYIEKSGTNDYKFSNVGINNAIIDKELRRTDCAYFRIGQNSIKDYLDNFAISYGEVLNIAKSSLKKANSSKWKIKRPAPSLARMTAEEKTFAEKQAAAMKKQLNGFFKNDENTVFFENDSVEISRIPGGNTDFVAKPEEITAFKKDIFSTCAAAYRIPLSIYNGENVTEADIKQFRTECVDFVANIIQSELNCQLFTFEDWKAGSRIEIDTTPIESLDISQIAHAMWEMISCGALSIDEVRTSFLGIEPLNTPEAMAHWITKNFSLLSDATTATTAEGGEENE